MEKAVFSLGNHQTVPFPDFVIIFCGEHASQKNIQSPELTYTGGHLSFGYSPGLWHLGIRKPERINNSDAVFRCYKGAEVSFNLFAISFYRNSLTWSMTSKAAKANRTMRTFYQFSNK
ncbi:MAG: hypothetical protein C5B52_16105 [Bacteroidetes bacterium]|nr:MAG: hypothetical protein C5B52_16105 [Bacteroidota bacterium]